DHIAIARVGSRDFWRVPAPARAADVFDAIDPKRGRRINLVRGHGQPVRVRVVDDALLKLVGEADVGFDEVVAERGRPSEFAVELRVAANRYAARVIDSRAVERIARDELARSDPAAAVPRLTQLEPPIRVHCRIPYGRDAVGEPDAAERLAVRRIQMRMHL